MPIFDFAYRHEAAGRLPTQCKEGIFVISFRYFDTFCVLPISTVEKSIDRAAMRHCHVISSTSLPVYNYWPPASYFSALCCCRAFDNALFRLLLPQLCQLEPAAIADDTRDISAGRYCSSDDAFCLCRIDSTRMYARVTLLSPWQRRY